MAALSELSGEFSTALRRLQSDWNGTVSAWSDQQAEYFGGRYIATFESQGRRVGAAMEGALHVVADMRRRYDLR